MNDHERLSGLPPRKRRDTVVVFDDDVMDRAIVEAALHEHYRLIVFERGEGALEAVCAARPALILCDIHLPGESGIALCKRFKNEPRLVDVPVVLITHSDDVELRLEGFRHGADDFIQKPYHARELQARVRAQVRVHRLLRELRRNNDELARVLNELQQAQTQLLRAERTNTALRMATALAHEINNPLAAIVGYADLVRTAIEEGEPVEVEQLQALERQAERIAEVVRRITHLGSPRFVRYAGDDLMVDLFSETPPPAQAPQNESA